MPTKALLMLFNRKVRTDSASEVVDLPVCIVIRIGIDTVIWHRSVPTNMSQTQNCVSSSLRS
jgi:hypothetical protein